MMIILRGDAVKKKLLRYFTGKPCYRGHISERAVSNRGCLECHSADEFLWRSNNEDASKARDAQFRKNHPESIARHRKENHSQESWQRKLDYMSVKNNFRREYSVGELSVNIRETLGRQQSWQCVYCHCDLHKTKTHLDHKIPLSLGGTNTDDNVQLLCAKCNLSKGAKPIEKYETLIGYRS